MRRQFMKRTSRGFVPYDDSAAREIEKVRPDEIVVIDVIRIKDLARYVVDCPKCGDATLKKSPKDSNWCGKCVQAKEGKRSND